MKVYLKAILLSIIIVAVVFVFLHNDYYLEIWQEFHPVKQSKNVEKLVIIHRSNGTIEKVELEQYLEGVVGAEMSASFELEALKAQAMAARTFVVYRNYEVDDSVQSQVYLDEQQRRNIYKDQYDYYQGRINQAIQATKGKIITYEHKPILSAFYATSCGRSANVEEYWQQALPYLRSVDSSWDQRVKDYQTQVIISKKQLQQYLGLKEAIYSIQKPLYYDSGYVSSIVINGQEFSGKQFRELCQLRSACFKVEIQNEQLLITCYGYGHGIGMSQNGAQYLALHNYTYEDIIKYYYQGVQIENIE